MLGISLIQAEIARASSTMRERIIPFNTEKVGSSICGILKRKRIQ